MNYLLEGIGNAMKSETLFSKGQKLAANQEFDKAISLYQDALKLKPDYSGLYLHLGRASLGRKKNV